MTLFGFNLLTTVRQGFGAVSAAFAGSVACCLCGALMAFVFAPGQAVQAYRISHLPLMDEAADVAAAGAGDAILITGILAGNAPLLDHFTFVSYSVEEWSVAVPEDDAEGPREPHGSWKLVETVVPELRLELDGQSVLVHRTGGVRLSGALHEETVKSNSASQTRYEGELLPSGTRRYRGLIDGDLRLFWGRKRPAAA